MNKIVKNQKEISRGLSMWSFFTTCSASSSIDCLVSRSLLGGISTTIAQHNKAQTQMWAKGPKNRNPSQRNIDDVVNGNNILRRLHIVSRPVITVWSKGNRTSPSFERNKVSVSIREGGQEWISHVTLAEEGKLKTWPGSPEFPDHQGECKQSMVKKRPRSKNRKSGPLFGHNISSTCEVEDVVK